nr:AAA family ATPase [Actinomycetales bacterium]
MNAQTLFELPRNAAEQQWRLAEVQLANWGTFHGRIYRIPVSRKGHLITGPSGSGKSSLLDAIAAVLTPDRWLKFNVAAQGSGPRVGQRTLVSYVRGAWSRAADEDEDRIVSQFLRPGATWSGILLRYENESEPGRPVTLARLMFAKGTVSQSADVNSLYLLDRSAIDLRELEPYVHRGLDTRKVKENWPDAVVTSGTSHGRFYSRMRNLFAIPNEGALHLLHRTQSAKNLDSLDHLFREYMLEEPATFRIADTAVEQFGELRDAHARVVELRMQRDHLAGLWDAAVRYESATAQAESVRQLADAVLPYEKHRSLVLARGESAALAQRIAQLDSDVVDAEAESRRTSEDHDAARSRSMKLGGSHAEQLQHRIRDAEGRARETKERWEALQRQLAAARIAEAPTTAAEFSELMETISRILTSADTAPGPSHGEHDRRSVARTAVERVEREIRDLRESRTGVPGALLAARRAVTDAVGLPTSALPFAAELMEVDPRHAEWTGAIERVLRPLALTMLVRRENLAAVRREVDRLEVRARLVYEEIPEEIAAPRPAGSDRSLVHRVRVREADGAFGQWIQSTISARYDYACVESPDEMDRYTRAVTRRGQVKISRTRYEKDDRFAVDESRHWVLGDGAAKLEALVASLREAGAEYQAASAVVEKAEAERTADQRRHGALEAIREQKWSDVDQATARAEVEDLTRRLSELTRADGDLHAAVGAADSARRAHEAARDRLGDARLELREARRERTRVDGAIADTEAALASGEIPELGAAATEKLDTRFRQFQRKITRENIQEIGHRVVQQLNRERDQASAIGLRAGNEIAQLAAQFNERWPAAAASAELTASLDDRETYLRVYEEIVANGLPNHEASFLKLLRERSRDLVGELVSEIRSAPQAIIDRVSPVNDSLGRSPFDEGRFLRLRVKVSRSETVNRFVADLRSISEGSWSDEDTGSAERKFETLAEMMRRFSSSAHIDRTWRTQCLDTRLHVAFLAEEVDANGRVHATYDSGAPMSGGQQQKLVVFCLAAALRYQLAAPDDPFPRYGTIIMDEAFDKADVHYTRMALDVFVEFGFHMVLATPQKLLQTIEPYVGAATSIENPSRKRSLVADVAWREGATAQVAGAAEGHAREQPNHTSDRARPEEATA